MKKILFLTAVLAVLSGTSCSKDETQAPGEAGADGKVTLEVSVPVTISKVTSTDGEGTVSSLQVFVFDSDGNLDAYSSGTSSSVSVRCATGQSTVAAVVNAPSLASISTLSALEATLTKLDDNATGAFVMYGTESVNVSASTSLSIDVTRYVARVGISKITNSFSLEQYQSATVKITGIYLINVAGDTDYAGTASPTTWYNKMKQSGDLTGLLYSGSLNYTLSYGTSYSTKHYFYCYPNPTSTDTSVTTWSARYTRLVVEVTVDGETYYYPISIPTIKRNCTYEITEMTITRLGSDSPDVPIDTADATFTVEVKDWTTGTSDTYTI